jgi:glycosyltransferase involved in cell wall biosynthesis
MRIGMFGNQNNYPFLLARALKGLGHDVRMLIDRPEPLNRPEHRYRDVPYPYPDWIEEVRRVEIDDVVCRTTSWQAVLDRLAACDAVVLNGHGIAAAALLDVPAFCLATGSDLDIYARPEMAEHYARNQETRSRAGDWLSYAWQMRRITRTSLLELASRAPAPLHRAIRKAMFRRFAQAQGAGLGRAAAVSYFPPGTVPAGDAVIERWVRPPSSRMFVYMTDLDALRPEPAPLNPVLRLFNATRFDWAAPFPPMVGAWENKRNDILVRGIAIYHRRTGRPIDVRFVTKGQSVPDTRALVRKLGIDGLVTWRGEMTQRDVFEEYTRADVVSEQFGRHAVGMAGFDALAMGRPVLCNWRPEIFETAFGETAPFLQARTPDEVADQLVRLDDVNLRADLGVRGRQFVERHVSPDRAARAVVAVLQRALDGRGRTQEAA